MEIISQIKKEIDSYIDGNVRITEHYTFSQHKLVKKIYNLANKIYPGGNIDSQGRYKYWFDIITPRINDETKNIDVDTKDIRLRSEMMNDRFRIFLGNAVLREYMKETRQAVNLNEDVEDSTGWGNLLFKKIKNGYTKLDSIDTYIINQKARTVDETPIIERHILCSSELREKKGVWYGPSIDTLIKEQGNKSIILPPDEVSQDATLPYYEIFERNGEVSVESLNEIKRDLGQKVTKSKDDADTYVLAKIIVAINGDGGIPLYAGEIKSMGDVYKEYHRGRYNGRWFREGFYEALMDIQIRCNEIGNQIALGLEAGGKQLFYSNDDSVFKSVMTDMYQGDIIKATSLTRVDTRFHELSNYIAEWNHLMSQADRITNAMEIVSGADTPSSMPFRLGALLDTNASKTYLYIREKLSLTFKQIYEDWILPDLIRNIKATDVIRITGDKDYLDEYRKMLVDNWYSKNLLAIGPHTKEDAELIKETKLRELSKRKEETANVEKSYWKGFLARIEVDITGESMDVQTEAQTLSQFLALETDPVRRQYLMDMIWTKYKIDVTKLPPVNLENQQMKAGTPAMNKQMPTPNQSSSKTI